MPDTLTPASTDDLADLLRDASARRLVVQPAGSATKLTWAAPSTAPAPGLRLSTASLTGLREHVWQDMTATVAAGTPWATLQQQLALHHQRVALDPLFPDRATVGGILATNDSGLLRRRFGSLRDLVLGVTIVLADGTIARSGGKVVKNVAGYDLPKLLIGSFGTLAILTEVTFRLHALPAHTAAFTARSPSILALADLLHRALDGSLSLDATQLRNEDTGFALDLLLATDPAALPAQVDHLHALAPTLDWTPADPAVWSTRERLFTDPPVRGNHTPFPEGPAPRPTTLPTVLKITSLPSKLAALVGAIALLNAQQTCTAHCAADPTGIVTAALSAPPDALGPLVADLRSRLHGQGGSVVVLQRGMLPETIDAWGPPPPALDLMRALKHEFDPLHLLNPGRFVGGI